jgi:hypothetical protein
MLTRFARPAAIGVGLIGITGALGGCSAQQVDHHYSDGLFSAVGYYASPGGPQGINVSVQLHDDVVGWVMVTPRTHLGEPGQFQREFAEAVPGEVVGKDIDSITVSRLAGSSLTSDAFNSAISAIKDKAIEAE